jgi:hypothetical protein
LTDAHDPATLEPQALTVELRQAALNVSKQAGRLYHLTREFDGAGGELGVGKRYEVAIAEAKIKLVEDAIFAGDKPPGDADYRAAKAEMIVRSEDPTLYNEHHRLTTEMEALRVWIREERNTIEARRSVLSAAKVLSGLEGN